MPGIKRFQRKMRAMPIAVRQALAPATLKGAQEIADMVEQLAPEDSGDLINSVTVTGSGQSTPAYSHPGGSHTVPEGAAAVSVGSSEVRYPHLVEYGTKNAPAQPFFWPAFRTLRKKSTDRIKREMTRAIKSDWGK